MRPGRDVVWNLTPAGYAALAATPEPEPESTVETGTVRRRQEPRYVLTPLAIAVLEQAPRGGDQ